MSMIGTRVVRSEDLPLLTGQGSFIDNTVVEGALHATFVRAQSAHALLADIDVSEALELDGVVAVLTAADLELEPQPPGMPMFNQSMTRTHLASDRVRYVGEPVAVILSETKAAGADALELVIVDEEPLEAVVDPRDAVSDRVLLFPEAGTNVAFAIPAPDGGDDIFDGCEVVVSETIVNHRQAPCPIEPRTAIARWDADDEGRPHLTQWACSQGAHGTRTGLAAALGVDPEQVRVIVPDVGGGFGAKNGVYPEDIVVAMAARRLGRPVRWVETRTESMLNMVHGRAWRVQARIGGSRDGDVSAYEVEILADGGAYPMVGSVLPMFGRMLATGVYDIPRVAASARSVVTNTVPIGAYRGAGRPEAALTIERMIDRFAAEIGIDPAEVRRRNFWPPEAFPLETPTGAKMDSGAYEGALDAVLTAVDYPALRAEQARRRQDPTAPLLGIGWSAYVEIANPIATGEFGQMEVRPDGSALLLIGTSPHGQGHHTAFAQVAADITGIPFDRIEVRHGDTDEVKRGGGTGGSRSLQVGGSAVRQAGEALVERAREQAASLLEADPADIVLDLDTGRFSVAGTPARSLSWAEIATHVVETEETPFFAEADFQPPGPTFPFGVHLSVVEIDRLTGQVTLVRHVSCDDAGAIVNPMLVEGQVHGGAASGILHALMEEFVYDPDGNPLTPNLMDYALGSAAELPFFERHEQQTPTDRNPLGAKGIGESATIGATPAVHNAVVDALSDLGIRHLDGPFSPQRVWKAIAAATG